MRMQKENGKKQQTMAERKLVIQEQHGWREDGNRFEAIRGFQIWPLNVRLKTRQAQKNKVFQPLYGIISFFCKQRMQMQRTRLKSLAYAIGQSMRIRHYGFANGYQSSKARSVGLQGNLDMGVMCHRSDG